MSGILLRDDATVVERCASIGVQKPSDAIAEVRSSLEGIRESVVRRCWGLGDVEIAVSERDEQDTGLASGQADECSVVPCGFGSTSVVVGAGGSVCSKLSEVGDE